MKRNWLSIFVVLSLVLGIALYTRSGLMPEVVAAEHARPAPEFTHTDPAEWLNSKPLTLDDLRGKVVLLDIWTFDCWNCYRSFPWLNGLEAKYESQGLQVIGVHSPEFEHEQDRAKLISKLKQFKLNNPQMIDNDFSYWKELGNRYWPTFYLIDKQGQLRARYIGETHVGDARAVRVESMVKNLLAEPN